MQVADIYIEYSASALDRSFCYECPDDKIEVGMRVKVMFAHREIIGFVVKRYEMSNQEIDALGYKLSRIISNVDDHALMNKEAFLLAKYMSHICVAPLISCFQAMLPSKLKPKSVNHKIKAEAYIVFHRDVEVKGKKQQEALAYIKEHHKVKRSEFNKRFSCLPRLIALEAVLVVQEATRAHLEEVARESAMVLNAEQQAAFDKISSSVGYHVHVLHGVTGSGKTEVFLHLAQKTLNEGKQVLILVPEISLTPQMVKRVKARFGKEVAIYHSQLNNQEKYEQFTLVFEKRVSIVVGTRSAVFMPFDNLGLIIMDEEHDQSYKQDSTPRYHCRDIAMKRGEYHNCSVVLASATPSLETYARAYKGVYQLVELKKRIYDNVPKTILVDMKDSMRKSGNYIISDTLHHQIQKRLDKHEQVIILLNRRGYAPILRCVECGTIRKCPHCDLALNYHKATGELVCHMCDYREPLSLHCNHCGSDNVKYLGLGTQKLEEFLSLSFPGARVLRMDADTTKRKNAHETLLQKFERHEYDILIGTQMIAKGLDFFNVTLVGILNGDAMLARTDYRSVELTFDLLEQASGRSGRGSKEGEVYIQVYDSDHYALQCVKHHDYQMFFKQEMQFRHLGKYPPYTYLASLIFGYFDDRILAQEVQALLQGYEGEVKVLGPITLLKRKDEYRMRIVLKSKDFERLLHQVAILESVHRKKKGKAKMEIDINPLYME